jgi:hypothetical protein
MLFKGCFKWLSFIQESHFHSDLIWHFNGLISPYQLDERYLRLEMSQLLSDAVTQSRTKTDKGIRMNSIAFTFPSLRSKLIRVLKVLLTEVVASRLYGNHCALANGYVLDVIILICHSREYTISWPIVSGCFVLNPINVCEFLQIFVSDVRVFRYDTVYLFS